MRSVFLPMDAEGQPKIEEPRQPSVVERRRHSRHRYSHSVEVRVADPRGRYTAFDAMTFEISESGLSAATPNILLVGEYVELNPVMGFRVHAIVRRKHGAMYGFEFVHLTDQQRQTIYNQCEKLPLFNSMLDL